MSGIERDLGEQPLHDIVVGWGLDNHHLVEASPEQLTHKQVQRARKGRLLTLKMKQKLARSLNFAIWGRLTNEERERFVEYFPKHLFSYNKGWKEGGEDPNLELREPIAVRPMRKDFRRELGLED